MIRILTSESSTVLIANRMPARRRLLYHGRGELLHPPFAGASSTDLFGKRRKARGRPLNPGRGDPLHPLFPGASLDFALVSLVFSASFVNGHLIPYHFQQGR